MKWIVFGWVVLITSAVHAKIAPEFPEPHHHFYSNAVNPDAIGHLFNSRGQLTQQRVGVSFAHQNREWEYDWFCLEWWCQQPSGRCRLGIQIMEQQDCQKQRKTILAFPLMATAQIPLR